MKYFSYFYYGSNCQYDNIKIGPCDYTSSSDPMILSYDSYDKNRKEINFTIDTSLDKESKVCLKFLRNDKTDIMMSEPFYMKVCSICPSIPDGCQTLKNTTNIYWKK